MDKLVQESFGQSIIEAIADFAKCDLDDVTTLEAKYLDHIGDTKLRTTLAETLYGARWIYKLGLALLVRDVEQMAHVRAQLIDYSSVCEGVLSDMIVHGINRNYFGGKKYQYEDTIHLRKPIHWTAANLRKEIERRNFYWFIEVAAEETIVNTTLKKNLHWLRKERNTVHLHSRTYKAFLGKSRNAFDYISPFAPSGSNCLNFELPVESRPQSQPL